MPQKKAHQKLSLLTCLLSIPIVCTPEVKFYQFLALEAGILITLMPEFTPDLDVNSRRFGPLSEFIGLKAYARLVPHRYGLRKRHWTRLRIWNVFFFSHLPFIGTVPRAILLFLPALFLILVFELFYAEIFWAMLYIYLGMGLSDTVHVIADKWYSEIKGHKEAFKEMDKAYWYGRRGRKS